MLDTQQNSISACPWRDLSYRPSKILTKKMRPCLSVCCLDSSASRLDATCSRLHLHGEFSVKGAPLLNFCCLTDSASFTVELRSRFAAFRATSASTVAIVFILDESSMVKLGRRAAFTLCSFSGHLNTHGCDC